MAKKFLTSLGLVSLASDPASGTEGELYYNNISDVVRLYKNGAWTDLVSSGNLPSGGATGQILAKSSNTDYAVEWIENYADYTEVVKLKVKNDGTRALYKGQPVYVTGADGTNVLVGRSSNVTEGGSSKTIGILAENLATNGIGFVIKEGKLGTLDTSTAGAVGDPVWLGVDGALIYGLANKPYAPAHLVYLGVVTKKNGSTGEIFVQVQNGFEIRELHDVGIGYSASIQNDQALVYNSSASVWNNADIVNSLYGTGNQIDVSSNNGDITLSLPNDLIAPGNLEVTGNLTVSGSTTYINTETLNIEDNIVILNSNVTGAPTGTSGIEIERGTEANKSILWTESNQSWVFDGDIRTYQIRSTDVFDIDVSSSGSVGGIINISADNASIVIDDIKRVVLTADGDSYKFAKDFIEFPDSSHQDTAFLGMSSYDTNDLDEGNTNLYFTNERAVSALTSTLSNYLLNSSASSTYLTQTNATNTYLTQANASATYQLIGSYLTTETDPVFSASDAASITSGSISNWNTAYGWGNHSIVGYLTTETDPVFSASDAAGIDATDISNWNTAYGWGNHASAGYALSSHNHTLDSLSNVVITGTPSDGQAIVWDTTTSKWVNETVSGGASYPDQTGNNGKFLQTNGASVSWQSIDFTGYLTESSASSIYLTQSSASSTYQPIGSYLTAESDTLETVTNRGASSTNAITITNTTAASSPITGALIVSGGVGIGEDLYVDNDVHIGGDIHITGSISGSLTYVNVTDLVVTDPLIYLAESNPNDSVDIGIFAALNHSSSAYYHTGLIRDASDSGKWKLASNLLDPTSNVIDFTGATFDTLKIGALEVTDASTTRTNLGLAIGTDVQAYNSTLSAVAGGTYSGDDSITTVGTIAAGIWNGSTIGYAYGGTGLTTLGTAGQVLKVNSGGTAIEWGTVTAGSSFTNSSELAALLSDETGSGSVVFSNSPTFTGTVSGITKSMVGLGNVEDTALSTWAGSTNITTLGTVTSGTWNGSVIGDSYINDALTISGGTINNTTIGATTAATGRFTSVNINDQAIIEGSTGTTTATSSFNTTTHSSAEFIVYGSTSTGNYVSKVLMLARGTATPVITEYAILTQGTAPTVTITPSYSAPNAVLTVTVSSGTNIEIIATEVSI